MLYDCQVHAFYVQNPTQISSILSELNRPISGLYDIQAMLCFDVNFKDQSNGRAQIIFKNL